MKITFDPLADAMYIELKKGEVRKTEVLDSYETMLDVDKNGNILGIEMLSVSRRFSQNFIKNLKSGKISEAPIKLLGKINRI